MDRVERDIVDPAGIDTQLRNGVSENIARRFASLRRPKRAQLGPDVQGDGGGGTLCPDHAGDGGDPARRAGTGPLASGGALGTLIPFDRNARHKPVRRDQE